MIDFEVYMLRSIDENGRIRWHNWGGLTEWMPDSPKGGTIWYDKDQAIKFASEYKSLRVEVVSLRVTNG